MPIPGLCIDPMTTGVTNISSATPSSPAIVGSSIVGSQAKQPNVHVENESVVGLQSPPQGQLKRIRKAPPCGTGGHKAGHKAGPTQLEEPHQGDVVSPPSHTRHYTRQHKRTSNDTPDIFGCLKKGILVSRSSIKLIDECHRATGVSSIVECEGQISEVDNILDSRFILLETGQRLKCMCPLQKKLVDFMTKRSFPVWTKRGKLRPCVPSKLVRILIKAYLR
nr:hypothetical protein CFP56_12768 [Quercus suber]